MKKMNRKRILAIFLCTMLMLGNSIYAYADSSLPAESPAPQESAQPTESPAPQESAEPTESPAPQESAEPTESPAPQESAQPTESPAPQEQTYQLVDGGENEVSGALTVNTYVTDNGDENENTFQVVLEAWVTGSLVETFQVAAEGEAPVKVTSAVETASLLDGTTMLKNQLSSYFDYYCACEGEEHTCLEVYTSAWDGTGFQDAVKIYPTNGEEVDQTAVTVNVGDEEITVTCFDYKAHPIVNGDISGNGQKLILKYSVEAAAGFWGGNNVPIMADGTAVYQGDQLQAAFPTGAANVPLSVNVSARDKTIYYGGTVSEGDLLDEISAGYEPTEVTAEVTEKVGKVTVNSDGSFSPAEEWMDDYAAITWEAYANQQWGAAISNRVSGSYTFTVKAVPTVTGSESAAGAQVPAEGVTDSDTGYVYVLIPVVNFRDTIIYRGFIPDAQYFDTYNNVSVEWTEMNGLTAEGESDEDPYTYPAPVEEAPQLYFSYHPERTDYINNTRVDVSVSSNIDNPAEALYMSDAVVFGGLLAMAAEENNGYEFTVEVKYKPAFELPATGGPGTVWYTLAGMMLLAGAVLLLFKRSGKYLRKGCAFILAVALAFSVVMVPKVYAALGVKTEEKCAIQVDLRESGHVELAGEGDLSIDVLLYKVADIDVSGNYKPLPAYSTLDFSVISSETTQEMWSFLADGAKKLVQENEIVATGTGATQCGVITITDLETGLYLVDVPQVVSDNYIYNFASFLVSLPNNYYYHTGDDTWVYELVGEKAINLKVEKLDRYGDLVINKVLDAYNATLGGATFVFQIEATKVDVDTKETEVVYSDVVSMTFDGTGKDSVVIRDIPAGAEVTVTEVYSGASYKVTTDAVQTGMIVAEDIISFEFENTYDDRLNGGGGIVNIFTYDSEAEGWIPSQAEDSTP